MSDKARGRRPTVFMLVEIKVREFRAKLHLASVLAQRGFRVYLGTRSAVMDAIAARQARAGIYYLKGGERVDVLRDAHEYCEFVVGQDEEIGPALSPSDVARAWRNRFPPSFAQEVDRLFAYSSSHLDILREVDETLAARATVTGWPRADLWSERFRRDDERIAAQLRSRHGAFALFVSNFKVTTEEQRDRSVAIAQSRFDGLAQGDGQLIDLGAEFGTRATHRLESFQRAVGLLREISRESPLKTIVRPHPSESPGAWRDALAGVEGVEVVYQGEVGPWLLAADAMLHTGCTTAVQSAFYGKSCGYLSQIGFAPPDYEKSAPYLVSVPLNDFDDVRDYLAVAREGPDPSGRWHQPDIDDVIGPRDGRSAERIADELVRLSTRAEAPLASSSMVGPRRAAAVAVGRMRRTIAFQRGRVRFVGTNAQAKVPGGIHAPEARRILRGMPETSAIEVDEPRFDLIRVEDPTASCPSAP